MNLEEAFRRSPPWAQTLMFNLHALRIARHRYGSGYRDALALLREQASWPADRIREYQDARLREVVGTAYRHSAHYRSAMDAASVGPDDIRTVEDLPKLPLLEKSTVRDRGASLLTRRRPGGDWLAGRTSGTTGSPLSLWYDRNTCNVNNAVDRLQKEWAGMRPHDWLGVFLGRAVVSPARRRPPFWQVNHVQRQVWFSSFHMGEENLDGYVREIRRRGVSFLEGYPSTLFILAKYLLQSGVTLPMTAVMTSSETLHPLQREAIESAFACRIFDFYGMAERAIFAVECDHHDAKHLVEGYGYAEVVDEAGQPLPPGRRGYLVGTGLHNLAMPMIRYRTADISSIHPEPCACGRALRRIEHIVSRRDDVVSTPGGGVMSPRAITEPFRRFPQILMSQVVQESLEEFSVLVVTRGAFTSADERALIAALRERLGPGAEVRLSRVDDIPRERSGKFRWFVSRVSHSHAIPWDEVAA